MESYIAEVATDIDFFEVHFSESTSEVGHSLPALIEGQSYYWRVFAVDAYGERSAPSQIHKFKVVAPPPED